MVYTGFQRNRVFSHKDVSSLEESTFRKNCCTAAYYLKIGVLNASSLILVKARDEVLASDHNIISLL